MHGTLKVKMLVFLSNINLIMVRKKLNFISLIYSIILSPEVANFVNFNNFC